MSRNPLLKEFEKVIDEIEQLSNKVNSEDFLRNNNNQQQQQKHQGLRQNNDLVSSNDQQRKRVEDKTEATPAIQKSIASLSASMNHQKLERSMNRLCFLIERILDHGIKDISLFGTGTYFWNYVENLDKCFPGNEAKESNAFLRKVREHAKGTLARGRIFVRLALNQNLLADYLCALIWNKSLTANFYRETSVLVGDDLSGVFLALLDRTKKFKFNFSINDKDLDAVDYWNKLSSKSSVASVVQSSISGSNHINGTGYVIGNETIRNIIEQAQSQATELEESRKTALNLRIQLEKEKKEKENLVARCKLLNQELKQLQDLLRDIQIELNVYKQANSDRSSDTAAGSSTSMASTTTTTTATSLSENGLYNPDEKHANGEDSQLASRETGEEVTSDDLASTDTGQASSYGDMEFEGGSVSVNGTDNVLFETLQKAQLFLKEMKDYDASIKERLLNVTTANDSNGN